MTTPNPTPEQIAETAAAKAPDRSQEARTKPLGIQEKKLIEKLINSDYDLLIKDMGQYKAELVRQRTIEINNQFGTLDEVARTRMGMFNDMVTRWRQELATWQQETRELGLVPNSRYGGRMLDINTPTLEIEGKQRALEEITREVDVVISRAKNALEHKRSEALRALVMSGGLPDGAREIMGNIPDPRETLIQAMDNSPRLLALTQTATAPVVAPQTPTVDGDIVEGLVIHDTTDYRQGV